MLRSPEVALWLLAEREELDRIDSMQTWERVNKAMKEALSDGPPACDQQGEISPSKSTSPKGTPPMGNWLDNIMPTVISPTGFSMPTEISPMGTQISPMHAGAPVRVARRRATRPRTTRTTMLPSHPYLWWATHM